MQESHEDMIKYAVTHTILAAFYLVPIWMCMKRAFCNVVETKGDTFWQKAFSLFMLLGCVVRLTSWTAAIFVVSGKTALSPVASFYWNLFPSFFFSSDYAVVLFSWMEIYHSTNEDRANLKPVYIYMTVVTYMAVIGVMIGDIVIFGTGSTLPLPETFLQKVLNTFDGLIYLVITIGYISYGGGFFLRFYKDGHGPLLQKMKQQILPRVKILTIAISICYTLRAIITIWNTWQEWPTSLFWVIDLVYYLFLEILPNVLMLIVLQMKTTDEPMQNKAEPYSTIQSY